MEVSGQSQVSQLLSENASAVSWSAVLAGAAATAALSLIMLMLGIGLGLSSVSPWTFNGTHASTMGIMTIIWLTLTQTIASGFGGYLSGRLRIGGLALRAHEVFFRDSAHGFLTWAIASIASAALLSTAIGAIVTNGLQVSAPVFARIANPSSSTTETSNSRDVGSGAGPMAYSIEFLFRPTGSPSPESSGLSKAGEVRRIFDNSIQTGPLPSDDLRYIGQLVSQQTGRPQVEAEKRTLDTYNQLQSKMFASINEIKVATDSLRKTSTYATLWLVISLLIGAFCASLAATFGGHRRDR
jgi:hypothetical protein